MSNISITNPLHPVYWDSDFKRQTKEIQQNEKHNIEVNYTDDMTALLIFLSFFCVFVVIFIYILFTE